MTDWCSCNKLREAEEKAAKWDALAQVTHCCPCGAQRTCHVEGFYYDDLMDEDYTDLSCGHHLRGAPREFDFCPNCGAKVVSE